MLYFNQPVLVLFCVLILATSTAGQGADIDYNCPVPECECATLDTAALADKVQLSCEIPYLSSLLNFTVIQTRYTTRLSLQCTLDFLTGQIGDGAFEHLTELEELAIFSCIIDEIQAETFSGLNSLKILNITMSKAIQFHGNTFDFTPNLEVINFADAQIRGLPRDMFCGLQKLKYLDLSQNWITSFNDVGLVNNNGTPCIFPELEWLNLLRNRIEGSLTVPFAAIAPNLQVLALHDNRISELSGPIFQNLSRLNYLDISNNNLRQIPEDDLTGSYSLKTLFISHNEIERLPAGLFQTTTLLEVFVAKNNNLRQDCVDADLFHNTPALKAIDLSSNQLRVINSAFFENLTQLQELYLAHNNLTLIEPGSFDDAYQLKILNMSSNRLNEFLNVNTDSNTYLPSLIILDLSYNKLTDASIEIMNTDAFPNILGLSLRANLIQAFPSALQNLRVLQELDLTYNNISQIDPSMFFGLLSLTMLSLKGNAISYIPANCFGEMQNLERLDLSSNDIKQIHRDAFRLLHNLHTIDLADNHVNSISGTFNQISQLKTLVLRGNNITTIRGHDFGNSIEELDLSSNLISYIEDRAFAGMSSLRTVRLNNNRLRQIYSSALAVSPYVIERPDFYISNNPYRCNCDMAYLQTINDPVHDATLSEIFGNVADVSSIICMKFDDPRRGLKFLVDVTEFYCTYEVYCEDTGLLACPCCTEMAVQCQCRKAVCPDACLCLRDNDDYNELLCSDKNLMTLPAIPSDAKIIHLDGNGISTLPKSAFAVNSSAKYLYLNDNKLTHIQPGAFRELDNLNTLNLSNNEIVSLPNGSLEGLRNLQFLYLKHNRLSSFHGDHIRMMPNLKTLDISNNYLKTLDTKSFGGENITTLDALYLSNNNWTCDCEFGVTFQQWLSVNSYIIKDAEDVLCGYVDDRVLLNDTASVLSSDFTHCINPPSERVVKSSAALPVTTIVMVVIFVLIVVLLVIIYAKRQTIQIWLYSRFAIRIYRQKEDTSRRFDAFISYSSRDEGMVVHELLPQLEEGDPPYTLCVHFRDWLIGRGIAESVIDSVNASRRTILLLSKNFIESEWCNYEFKTAHHRVLKDESSHLIVILLEDEPPEGIDKELQQYIKTHTYIRYSDPWFWKRLKFALPDVSDEQKAERIKLKQQEKDTILEQRKFIEERNYLREFQQETEVRL